MRALPTQVDYPDTDHHKTNCIHRVAPIRERLGSIRREARDGPWHPIPFRSLEARTQQPIVVAEQDHSCGVLLAVGLLPPPNHALKVVEILDGVHRPQMVIG